MQHIRPKPHFLQRSWAEILDEHVRRRQQIVQHVLARLRPQIQREAFFVTGVDFPVQREPLNAPGTQRIADFRVLDFDHLGALIGELQAHHVAGDEAGQIDDPKA
jgi:hypothetical protein